MASLFTDENIHNLLDDTVLQHVIQSLQTRVDDKEVLLGGNIPPSCKETSVLSQAYNPVCACSCDGLFPVPGDTTVDSMIKQSGCIAIKTMVDLAALVLEKEDEWSPKDLFTSEHLKTAIQELSLMNSDQQQYPKTCTGGICSMESIQAPDRRPNPECDSDIAVFHQLYSTKEKVKLLTDAKYFFCNGLQWRPYI